MDYFGFVPQYRRQTSQAPHSLQEAKQKLNPYFSVSVKISRKKLGASQNPELEHTETWAVQMATALKEIH